MNAAASTHGQVLAPVAVDILESLYQHRLLTATQVNALHTPENGLRWTRRILTQLHQHQLIDRAGGPQNHALWYLTEHGADTVEALSTRAEWRRRVASRDQAAGPLRAHTLAVNDVGLAFVRAAREKDDDCGALSWRHEIAHPISPARPKRPAELLVADALLTYVQADEESILLHQRFIELDRGTLPAEQFAAKFTRYARLHDYRPASKQGKPPARPLWCMYYRAFPSVLVVLADQEIDAARRRIQRVIALHNTDPEREQFATVPVSFVTLADLGEHGPFAPIFIDLHNPGRYVNWLGHSQPER